MGISRQSGESIKDYTIRLCRNREQYGLKWDDVAALINKETGDDYGESRYRKWFSAWSEGYEDGLRERLDGDPLIQEYEDKRIEMQKERVRLADQRRVYNALIREQARLEYIRDEIRKSIAELASHKPLQWSEPTIHNSSNVHGVALWSDWHYGAKSDNYFNKYNTDIFNQRLDRLITKTIENGLRHNVHTLHVVDLADNIAGHIHVTTRIQATENVIKQTQRVAEAMCEALVRLASVFPVVKLYRTRGNHDRVHNQSKDANISAESFSDIITWYLQARLEHVPNIELVPNPYDDEIIVADVCGHVLFGVHGHKDKIDQVAANLSLMLKVVPDAILLGHYHHSVEKEMTGGIDVIVNGSLCGVDEYARDIRKTSKPSQKFLIYDETGRICTYNILLQ